MAYKHTVEGDTFYMGPSWVLITMYYYVLQFITMYYYYGGP